MQRRSFLGLGLGLAAASLPLAGTLRARAEDEATPAVDPDVAAMDFVDEQASRAWERPEGGAAEPFNNLYSWAWRFDSEDHAGDATPHAVVASVFRLAGADAGAARRLSIPLIGDESAAFEAKDGNGTVYPVLVFRKGNIVVGMGCAVSDPSGAAIPTTLEGMVQVAQSTAANEKVSDDVELVDGLVVGGLSDHLPGYANLPVGFALASQSPDLVANPWLAGRKRTASREWTRSVQSSGAPEAFYALAHEFTSDDTAKSALAGIAGQADDRWSEVETVEVEKIGDETTCVTGVVGDTGRRWALLGFRKGSRITVLQISRETTVSKEDAVKSLVDVANEIEDQKPGEDHAHHEGDVIVGGLYDTLPGNDQVPEGFVATPA